MIGLDWIDDWIDMIGLMIGLRDGNAVKQRELWENLAGVRREQQRCLSPLLCLRWLSRSSLRASLSRVSCPVIPLAAAARSRRRRRQLARSHSREYTRPDRLAAPAVSRLTGSGRSSTILLGLCALEQHRHDGFALSLAPRLDSSQSRLSSITVSLSFRP